LRTGHATQRGDVFRREVGGHGASMTEAVGFA
jgi:hypothetical protein